MVKTPRRPRHAGGRPPLFIPIAVVARAVELARSGSDFSTVVRKLEAEGNGAWPRKTLMRRVASTSSSSTPARGQNRRRRRSPASSSSALQAVAKTTEWDGLGAAAERRQHRRLEAASRKRGTAIDCGTCGVAIDGAPTTQGAAKARSWDELMDAVHAADEGTPELDEAIAALHAAPEYGRGRCHCEACKRRARAAA